VFNFAEAFVYEVPVGGRGDVQEPVGLGQAGGAPTTGLLLAGLAEATVPVFVGLALVAVAWLLAAVGLRKQL
jgi:hypothetical protein